MGIVLLAAVLAAAHKPPVHPPTPADPFQWVGKGPKLDESITLRELTLWRNDIYARAHNPFRKRWLDTWFRQFKWYQPEAMMNVTLLSGTAVAHAQRVGTFEASLTRAQLLAKAQRTNDEIGLGPPNAEQQIELRLLSVRLGGWAGRGQRPGELNPLEDPEQLEQLVSVAQLSDFSPRDLKLLRETVRARRGFGFDDEDLAGHFRTASWYQQKDGATLSKLDRVNIKIIDSVLATIHQPEPTELIATDWVNPLNSPPRMYGWG